MITIQDIKAQRTRVNTGLNVESDYQKLRQLQKEFTNELVTKSGINPINIYWATLRQLRPRDFPAGTKIRVGKYRIVCDGKYVSQVYHSETLKDLRTRDMPIYLKEFIGV
jgi:hypothetical protein